MRAGMVAKAETARESGCMEDVGVGVGVDPVRGVRLVMQVLCHATEMTIVGDIANQLQMYNLFPNTAAAD